MLIFAFHDHSFLISLEKVAGGVEKTGKLRRVMLGAVFGSDIANEIN